MLHRLTTPLSMFFKPFPHFILIETQSASVAHESPLNQKNKPDVARLDDVLVSQGGVGIKTKTQE